jgi:hypothetical protein
VHAAYVPVADPGPSSLHSNVEPGSELENPNDGDALLVVPVGPESIVVSGAVMSTVNERDAAVASTLPTPSLARTRNVYAPLAVVVYARGDVQAAYVPAPAGVSSLHSNVAPASEENANDGAVPFVTPVGPPVIVVSGGPVSTVKDLVAGVGSTLPAGNAERTLNV